MKQQFTGPISLDVAARTVTLHGIALPAERVLLAVNSTVGFIYHIHEHKPANISIDPSFSTVIHFADYKDCDTHQDSDAVSVFYEDGVDLGEFIRAESDQTQTLLQTEFDQTQADLVAFRTEVKAESDQTQTLLQTEFDQTQTDLAAFRAEVKAESDQTQTLLQTEFDQTQADLVAFRTEVKAESDQTQTLLQTEFDQSQADLAAFRTEVKAENDQTQALLQTEFGDTRTQLTAFQTQFKSISDATQVLLQTEFDQSQANIAAFQGELKSESDETQLILTSKLSTLDAGRIPVEKTEAFGTYTVLSNGSHGPNEIAYTSPSGATTIVYMAYNSAGDLVWISPTPLTPDFAFTPRALAQQQWSELYYAREGSNDAFLATGANTYSYSLDGGNTWKAPTSPWNSETGNEFYQAVCYGGGRWLATEIGNANGTTRPTSGFYSFYTTTSLASGWTKVSVPSMYNAVTAIPEISYDSVNGRFMLCIDGIIGKPSMFMKYDAVAGTWSFDSNTSLKDATGGILLANGTYNNVVDAAGLYVGVASGGYFKMGWSSDRGVTWNQGRYNGNQTDGGPIQNLQSGSVWSSVTYGGGVFVASNSFGSTASFQFAYSTDGKNWHGSSYTSADLKRNWTCIAYFAGRFVSLADSGNYQAISFDGINWQAYKTVPTSEPFIKLTPSNSRLVALLNSSVGNSIYVAV